MRVHVGVRLTVDDCNLSVNPVTGPADPAPQTQLPWLPFQSTLLGRASSSKSPCAAHATPAIVWVMWTMDTCTETEAEPSPRARVHTQLRQPDGLHSDLLSAAVLSRPRTA